MHSWFLLRIYCHPPAMAWISLKKRNQNHELGLRHWLILAAERVNTSTETISETEKIEKKKQDLGPQNYICQLGPAPPCSQMIQKHVLKYVTVNCFLIQLPLETGWLITSHKLQKNMMSAIYVIYYDLSRLTLYVLSSLNEN